MTRDQVQGCFSNKPWLARVPSHPFDLWTRANVGEVFPGVISPLLWSTSKKSMNTSIQATLEGLKIPNLDRYRFFDLFYGRIYFNEGALVHVLSNIVGLPRSFAETSLGTRLTVPPDKGAEKYHWGRIVRRLPGLLRTVRSSQGAGKKLEAAFPRIEQEARKRQEVDLAAMIDQQLLQTQAELGKVAHDCYQLYNSVNGMAVSSLASLHAFIERWADHDVPVNDLVTGLEGIKTAEIAPRLWRIATEIRKDPALLSYLSTYDPAHGAIAWHDFTQGAAIAQQIDAFLQEYGHHCTDEYEIMVPR
ncbi:MAG: hypothetical protein JXA93_20930, partial [Anaerolineae bacterium]|nr:hypothetical protein [Anaerolineae bacterium]